MEYLKNVILLSGLNNENSATIMLEKRANEQFGQISISSDNEFLLIMCQDENVQEFVVSNANSFFNISSVFNFNGNISAMLCKFSLETLCFGSSKHINLKDYERCAKHLHTIKNKYMQSEEDISAECDRVEREILKELSAEQVQELSSAVIKSEEETRLQEAVLKKQTSLINKPFFTGLEAAYTDLFSISEEEKILMHIFENSKWVRVYSGKCHYVAGIIYKDGSPEILGVGAPVYNKSTEVKFLGGEECFVPVSRDDESGFGYKLLLLSAKNGSLAKII